MLEYPQLVNIAVFPHCALLSPNFSFGKNINHRILRSIQIDNLLIAIYLSVLSKILTHGVASWSQKYEPCTIAWQPLYFNTCHWYRMPDIIRTFMFLYTCKHNRYYSRVLELPRINLMHNECLIAYLFRSPLLMQIV